MLPLQQTLTPLDGFKKQAPEAIGDTWSPPLGYKADFKTLLDLIWHRFGSSLASLLWCISRVSTESLVQGACAGGLVQDLCRALCKGLGPGQFRLGPFGAWPIWALAYLGLGPFGP